MRQSDTWVSKANLLAASFLLLLISLTGLHAQSFSVPRVFGIKPDDPLMFGQRQNSVLVEGPDRAIYGTSPQGGQYQRGTIFRITTDGTMQVLHSFDAKLIRPGVIDGSGPQGGLTCAKGSDGKCTGSFYGTTYNGGLYNGGTFFRTTGKVGPPDILYQFRAGYMVDIPRKLCPPSPCPYTPQQRLDAAAGFPLTAPVQGSDGNFYGISSYSWNYKYGVLYRISPGGAFQALCINGDLPKDLQTTDPQLIKQCMFNGEEGSFPVSLVAGSDGNLYGTCLGGLSSNPYGTVFRASLDGKVAGWHKFDRTKGMMPYSIMQATQDDPTSGKTDFLYGTTWLGGSVGAGVVFRVNQSLPTFSFDVVTDFRTEKLGESLGLGPVSGLVEGLDGSLYGTTRLGGRSNLGVLFKVSKMREGFRVLHNFSGTSGAHPMSTPLLHSDGSFYGVTSAGGKGGGVFYNLCVEPEQGVPDKCASGDAINTFEPARPTHYTVEDSLVRVDTSMKWTNQPTVGRKTDLDDGILITVKNCKRNPQVVQFISREQKLANGTWQGGPLGVGATAQYCLTTNNEDPDWHTDTSAKPSPYYYGKQLHCDGTLKTFDQPNFPDLDPKDLMKYEFFKARFVSFVLCNGEVVRQIRWIRTRTINRWAEPLGYVEAYYVDQNMMPDPMDVKRFQCLSSAEGFNPWAPCSMRQPPAQCPARTAPNANGEGCPLGP